MTAQTAALITEDELDLLEEFLFSSAVSDEALDLIGAHGLLCAINISPAEVPEPEWLESLFDGEPQWQSEEQKTQILGLLRKLKHTISHDLYSDPGDPAALRADAGNRRGRGPGRDHPLGPVLHGRRLPA